MAFQLPSSWRLQATPLLQTSLLNVDKIISHLFSVSNLKLPEAVLKEVAQAEKVRIDLPRLKRPMERTLILKKMFQSSKMIFTKKFSQKLQLVSKADVVTVN